MDSSVYQRVLREAIPRVKHEMFEDRPLIFQQDGAPCHTSVSTGRWLTRHQVTVMDWPPQSPDLNPIENLWAILKHRVNAMRPITSLARLEEATQEAWGAIPQETIRSLVESMPGRVRAVLRKRGVLSSNENSWGKRGSGDNKRGGQH